MVSANLEVTPGQPFVLRNREVFNGLEIRSYQVYVDGILVKTMTTAPDYSVAPSPSSTVYDLVVDTPATLAATQDGRGRRSSTCSSRDRPSDPSFGRLLGAARCRPTHCAPLVASTVTAGIKGEGDFGWYRSAVRVRFDAVDNGNQSPTLWIQRTPELSDTPEQMNPVTTEATDQGTNVLYYWASTGNQNFTSRKTMVIRIDSVAPDRPRRTSSTPGPGQATLRFYASDATSAGPGDPLHASNGGAWQVTQTRTTSTKTSSGRHRCRPARRGAHHHRPGRRPRGRTHDHLRRRPAPEPPSRRRRTGGSSLPTLHGASDAGRLAAARCCHALGSTRTTGSRGPDA